MLVCEKTDEMVERFDDYRSAVSISPFVRKTARAVLTDLACARDEIARGEGVPADMAMARLGERYGFV